jgi:hypothetical protein
MAKPKAEVRPNETADKAKGQDSPKKRADWEAIERDYRTGRYTLRELEGRHGVSYAEISRHSKKQGWTKDLRDIIKHATDAALLRETVTEAQKDVTETILIAAEMNKAVILGHRTDIKATRDVTAILLHELSIASLLAEAQEILSQVLAGSGAEPVDEARARAAVQKALSITNRIQGVKALADTFDKLQVAERRAFGLDEKTGKDAGGGLADMATEELQRLRKSLMGEA